MSATTSAELSSLRRVLVSGWPYTAPFTEHVRRRAMLSLPFVSLSPQHLDVVAQSAAACDEDWCYRADVGSTDDPANYWPVDPEGLGVILRLELDDYASYDAATRSVAAHALWSPSAAWVMLIPMDGVALAAAADDRFMATLLELWPPAAGLRPVDQVELVVRTDLISGGYDYLPILEHMYGDVRAKQLLRSKDAGY